MLGGITRKILIEQRNLNKIFQFLTEIQEIASHIRNSFGKCC